jgi:hypothetical protein
MESLTSYAGQELVWLSSKTAKRTYQLRDGDRIFATLVQPSLWRQTRVVESATDHWTLTLQGMTGSTLLVSNAMGAEVARLKRSSWKSAARLELTGGGHYTWRAGNWLGAKWVWLDENEQPALHLAPQGVFRARCAVVIEAVETPRSDLALLAALGWYLIQLQNAETAAAVASTTVITS